MFSFMLSRSLLVLLVSLLPLFSSISSEATSSLSFSFSSSYKNASLASDDIALYGDAKLVDGGSSIQLSHDRGLVVYKKPTVSVDINNGQETNLSDYLTVLSTEFSSSMPPGRGGRIGFVMFRANGTFDHPFFQVMFDISKNFKDSNVTVIVAGSSKISYLSSRYMEMEKEKLLYAKTNFQTSGYNLVVFLSKEENFESTSSLYISRIDLMKDEVEFLVGLKSYSGNFNLHSWSLQASYVSKKMFSADTILPAEKGKGEENMDAARRRTGSRMMWPLWIIVTCLLMMTFGFMLLAFFALMYIWAAFKRNDLAMVTPEECGLKTNH